MGLFKRKKKKEEEGAEQKNEAAPTLPELPELPSIKPELSPLVGEKNLAAKQESLETPPTQLSTSSTIPLNSQIPEPPQETKIPEPPITQFQNPPTPQLTTPPATQIITPATKEVSEDISPLFRPIPKKTGPLFVKLEKFESAMNSLEEIKQKISEIESLLTNIKEIKNKEEQELTEWQKEIQNAKEKIASLDKELFGKL